MSYKLIDCCPVPYALVPEIEAIKKAVPGATLESCYRGTDAAALLAKCGKHDQAYLYAHRNDPGFYPANPPGRSTHECRSDGVAYPGPIGRVLDSWCCGMDWDDGHIEAIIAAAKKLGWVVVRPYPSGSEHHHLNFQKQPKIFTNDLKLNDRGPRVWLLTHRLGVLGYLPHSGLFFSKNVENQLKAFQKDHKLIPDGVAGSQTIANLIAACRLKRQNEKPSTPKYAATPSKEIAAAIADFEGGQSSDGLFYPYQDSTGVWTIGYGHIEGVSAKSKPLTKTQAIALLSGDLAKKYGPAVARYKFPLNQKQFDALVSFVYNVGPGYLDHTHTIGAALAKRDWKGVANAFLLYDRAGGKALPGLTRRRKWERQLFLGGTYTGAG